MGGGLGLGCHSHRFIVCCITAETESFIISPAWVPRFAGVIRLLSPVFGKDRSTVRIYGRLEIHIVDSLFITPARRY